MEEGKVQEVLAMHDAGISISNIASEMLISNQTVRRVLKEHGKDTSRKPKTSVDPEAISQDYLDGRPIPEILSKFNITYTVLYKCMTACGVPTRKVSDTETNKVRLNHAVEMYVAGAPLWSIRQETGIAQPTLHNELHSRDIPLRRPRML